MTRYVRFIMVSTEAKSQQEAEAEFQEIAQSIRKPGTESILFT